MTARPVLALDVDECLFPFLEYYAHWLPQVGLPSFTLEQMQGFGVAELLGMTPVQSREFEMRFVCEAGYDVAPMPGAREAIEALAARFELHAVTARVEDVAGAATRDWLDRWFPGSFAAAHLQFGTVDSVPTPKGEVCTSLGARFLVDDRPLNLVSLESTGTEGVLLGTWPWTGSHTGDWFHALDWPLAVDHLLDAPAD